MIVVVVMVVFVIDFDTSSTFLNQTWIIGVSGSSSSNVPSYKSSLASSNNVTHLDMALGFAVSTKIYLSKLTLPEYERELLPNFFSTLPRFFTVILTTSLNFMRGILTVVLGSLKETTSRTFPATSM